MCQFLGSQDFSETLRSWCDQAPGSWDPGIVRSWVCQSAWKWYLFWGQWGWPQCVQNQGRPVQTRRNLSCLLVRQGSCVPAPAGPRHSQLCWNRCCVPLTSGPKILGMLGFLGSGEGRVLWGPWDYPLSSCPRWPRAGVDWKELEPLGGFPLSLLLLAQPLRIVLKQMLCSTHQ